MPRPRFAIVGGGRWAGEIAATLASLIPDGEPLLALSPSNPARWRETAIAAPIETAASIDEICQNPQIEAAFVVRAARDHAATARMLLAAGKSVFVEKPFALSIAEADSVVNTIAPGKICLTGLVFLHARNISNFIASTRALNPLRTIRILWADPVRDTRRGQEKRYDSSINVVADVFPHVWSILRMISDSARITIRAANISQDGSEAKLELLLGETEVEVRLSRHGEKRQRRIELQSDRGSASLDFSGEPGTAEMNGNSFFVGEGHESPLKRELSHFLLALDGKTQSGLADIRKAIESIRLTEECAALSK